MVKIRVTSNYKTTQESKKRERERERGGLNANEYDLF